MDTGGKHDRESERVRAGEYRYERSKKRESEKMRGQARKREGLTDRERQCDETLHGGSTP